MATPKYLTVENVTPKEAKRIFSKIAIDPVSGCWKWLGAPTGKDHNYGQVGFRKHRFAIHRFMYAWYRGPIPEGVSATIPVIDHACDNTLCCNPDHLELKSQRENSTRGNNPPAINARKTHCIRGHPLPNKPNMSDGKRRECKTCHQAYDRERRHQARTAANRSET